MNTVELLARVVHVSWRDGMLSQGRDVAPNRMEWETLSTEDKALDILIAGNVLMAFFHVQDKVVTDEEVAELMHLVSLNQAQADEIARLRGDTSELRAALTNIQAKSQFYKGETLMHIRWRFQEIATTAQDALVPFVRASL